MPYERTDGCDGYDDGSDSGNELTFDGASGRSEAFEYVPAEAYFDPAELYGLAAALFPLLVNRGMTQLRATYDGGHDEELARAETVWFAGAHHPRSAADVVTELSASGGIVELLRSVARERSARISFAGEPTPTGILIASLDMLARAVASRLVGDGYGTGEYQLYGALTVDFASGRITDDQAARRPPSMD